MGVDPWPGGYRHEYGPAGLRVGLLGNPGFRSRNAAS